MQQVDRETIKASCGAGYSAVEEPELSRSRRRRRRERCYCNCADSRPRCGCEHCVAGAQPIRRCDLHQTVPLLSHLSPHIPSRNAASDSLCPPLSDCTVGPVLTRVVCTHIVNTITSARHVVMRNDDRIRAAATNADSLGDSVRDQGYSRARVLVLVPFKCSAVRVVNAILDACPGAAGDISGYDRFLEEFDIVDEVNCVLKSFAPLFAQLLPPALPASHRH